MSANLASASFNGLYGGRKYISAYQAGKALAERRHNINKLAQRSLMA
jgi:hypothetical protein